MEFEHLEEKEAVEKAALIEKNGFVFYSHLADVIENTEVREALKALASDEERHLRILEKSYFPEAGFPDIITDEEIEIERYVKREGVPDLFTRKLDMPKLIAAIDNPKKALLIALDAEIHSAEYFTELAESAKTEAGRTIYKELADEERGHAKHIEELLEKL